MLSLPHALKSQVETARTHYYATCWRITPSINPSAVVRVTDWPVALTLSETDNGDYASYSPAGGAEGSATRREGELRPGGKELQGIVTTDLITDVDLDAGKYDGSRIDEYVVDARRPWVGPLWHATYWITVCRFDRSMWVAELRDFVSFLNDPVGEQWGASCRVDLFSQGPAKCNLNAASYQLISTVSAVITQRIVFRAALGSALPWAQQGYAEEGTVQWTSGANTGATAKIKTHVFAGPSTHTLELHVPAGFAFSVGDQGIFLPGCNHLLGAKDAIGHCVNRYSNGPNFQAEPFLPGRDAGAGGIPSL